MGFEPVGVSDTGVVVGNVRGGDIVHQTSKVVTWNSGQTTDLPSLNGSTMTTATAISSAGVIVGNSGGRPVIWRSGQVSDLGGPAGAIATAVNDDGDAVGYVTRGACPPQATAVSWFGGKYAPLDRAGNAIAIDVNNGRQVLLHLPGGPHCAFNGALALWSNGSTKDLSGTFPSAYYAALNDNGMVVGGPGAKALDESGTASDIGRFAKTEISEAKSVNSFGEVVGILNDNGGAAGGFATDDSRAYLWEGGNSVNDLNIFVPNSGWVLQDAVSVSSNEQIVGTGKLNGQTHGYLLSLNRHPWNIVAVAGDGLVTLSWSPPTSGPAIATYTVTVAPGGQTISVPAASTNSIVGPRITTEIKGLTSCTAYTFTVMAVRATRAGPSAPSDPAVPRGQGRCYIALGDSFSSGEGAPDADSPTPFGSTDSPSDRCHRSDLSYPYLLAKTSPVLSVFASYACSGATSTDIQQGYGGEPSQLDHHLGPATKLVTITAGGDDAGFADVAAACLLSEGFRTAGLPDSLNESALRDLLRPDDLTWLRLAVKSPPLHEALSGFIAMEAAACTSTKTRDRINTIGSVYGALDKLYTAIHKQAHNAHVVVLLYPNLLPQPGTPSAGQGWCRLISEGGLKYMNQLEFDTNLQVISTASRHHFEVVHGSDVAFGGRDLCGPGSNGDVNGLGLDLTQIPDAVKNRNLAKVVEFSSLHPTQYGYQAMEQATATYLQQNPLG